VSRGAWVAASFTGFLAGLLAPARAPAADSCSVSASGVNFGVYDPTSGSSATSTGTLLVSCNWTAPAPAQITVSVYLSTGSSGTYSARSMTSGSNRLTYNLFFNANGSTIWGNGTGGSYYGTATIVTGTPSGSGTANGTLYGIAPAGQDVAPGAYSDTIVVTVNY
jgi:spore coat protein U-like protein